VGTLVVARPPPNHETIRTVENYSEKAEGVGEKLQELRGRVSRCWYSGMESLKVSIKEEMERHKRKAICCLSEQLSGLAEVVKREHEGRIAELESMIEQLKAENHLLKREQLKEECSRSIENEFMKIKLNEVNQLSRSETKNCNSGWQKERLNYSRCRVRDPMNQTEVVIRQIKLRSS
jgi:hypothetical protein